MQFLNQMKAECGRGQGFLPIANLHEYERRKFPSLCWTEYYAGKLLILGAENQLFPVTYTGPYFFFFHKTVIVSITKVTQVHSGKFFEKKPEAKWRKFKIAQSSPHGEIQLIKN